MVPGIEGCRGGAGFGRHRDIGKYDSFVSVQGIDPEGFSGDIRVNRPVLRDRFIIYMDPRLISHLQGGRPFGQGDGISVK